MIDIASSFPSSVSFSFFLFLFLLHFFSPITFYPGVHFSSFPSFSLLQDSFSIFLLLYFFLSFSFSRPHSRHKFMSIHPHKSSCFENQHSNYVFSLASNTNNRQMFNDLTSVSRGENQYEVLQQIP